MAASNTDLGNLPSPLDLAALMRHVLAGHPREEDIDAALRRVIQQEYPQAEEGLFSVLSEMLTAEQRMLGISRQEAATQLAQAKSEMRISPEGKPEITSFRYQFQAEGLERLSPEQREHVLEQLETAARTGGPIPKVLPLMPRESQHGASWLMLGVIVVILCLAAIYSFGYFLARG
jgi:hypothetical protein